MRDAPQARDRLLEVRLERARVFPDEREERVLTNAHEPSAVFHGDARDAARRVVEDVDVADGFAFAEDVGQERRAEAFGTAGGWIRGGGGWSAVRAMRYIARARAGAGRGGGAGGGFVVVGALFLEVDAERALHDDVYSGR